WTAVRFLLFANRRERCRGVAGGHLRGVRGSDRLGATVWLVGGAGPSGHVVPGAGAGAHDGAAVGWRAPQSSVPGGQPVGERSAAAGPTGSGGAGGGGGG